MESNNPNNLTRPFFREHPDKWVEQVFGEKLWIKEKEILFSIRDNRLTSVKSAHGVGKSFISGRAVLHFLYTYDNPVVITTAPSFRQVQDILWREIRKAKVKSKIPLAGTITTTRLDISPDSFALGLSTDEPDRFQGFHAVNIMLIVDEAAGVKEEIYEAAEGIVSSAGAKVLLIGNPTSVSGTFYKSFNPNSSYNKISISAFDTPNFTTFGITLDDIRNNTWETKVEGKDYPMPYLTTPDWVADKFKNWGEGTPMWDSRVLGLVPEQGDDTLIKLSLIEAAKERTIEPKDVDPEYIGVDVARFGSDKTIIIIRHGPLVVDILMFSKFDTMKIAEKLFVLGSDYPNATISIDVIGLGAGVYDRLCQLLDPKRLVPMNVAEKAYYSEQFVNKRAEMYWTLRQRFVDGEIAFAPNLPELETLMGQLAAIKYEFRNGKIKIEEKAEIKKRIGVSPDHADSLMIAFGTINVVSYDTINFTKPKLTDAVSASQETNILLTNEEERKKLEQAADLEIMARAAQQARAETW